ncbi:hypothetical protein P22_3584 [Propionispora sp. 2/2-37]|uniref:TIGR03960 family B12-binding radical SAM protein n=1 Tax=Propionispora sp. 2/2-37 TaxID=1677858 RepID=UPI0006BB7F39|nr:TIGR03960 family B12-binding radical SAM protein [Propionispora sp. 2/2-37]CUH97454.1 hypothetical protein P22_3584 [Propionispora sp. 2/2-37]
MINISQSILTQVAKPARYTGNELNSVKKNHSQVDVTIALALPDVYEVGMSNLGLKILYQILNDRRDTAAERVYAPWVDMEELMRKNNIPLYSLETFTPLADFDLIGFSLQYELSYTNVLNMLDLAKIPVLSKERNEDYPLVVGGGPCAFNAEPVADFFDLFVLGEGEEVIEEIVDTYKLWKKSGKKGGKSAFLQQVATVGGVYVPSLYEVFYQQDGTIDSIRPKYEQAAPHVEKRVVRDLDAATFVTKPVVPFLDIVHDRIMLELFRGCTRGCRFCQAGILYRPVREKKLKTLIASARQLVDHTGYNEISLTSLSSADYSCLHELVRGLMEEFKDESVSVSLPSLRIDSFSIQLAQEVQQVRKSGLTFAPEAGTQRMRNVINKGVTEKDLEEAVTAAFRAGWSTVKLYFMIGLPTETEEDIRGIAELAKRVAAWYKEIKGRRGARVTVSVSSFVPKPHTPFQWYGQNSIAEIEEKQELLRSLFKQSGVSFSWHDAKTSFLEGVLSRGDRRLGKVILRAWQQGAKFDGWSEHFKFDVWMDAFSRKKVDPGFYARRERSAHEILPWEHLHSGVFKEFLLQEYNQAIAEAHTADCRRTTCSACGVCQELGVQVVDWKVASHA